MNEGFVNLIAMLCFSVYHVSVLSVMSDDHSSERVQISVLQLLITTSIYTIAINKWIKTNNKLKQKQQKSE